MLERDVVDQCVSFMRIHGWRPFRTHFSFQPGAFSTCEPGCPDYQFIRYMPQPAAPARCMLVWIEFKSPRDKRVCTCQQRVIKALQAGKKRRPSQCNFCRQRDWREAERSLGACVMLVSSLDQLQETYSREFGWLHRNGVEVSTGQLPLKFARDITVNP